MIYTSYFAKPPKDIEGVAICRGIPEWFHGKTFQEVAPTIGLLHDYKAGLITEEEYAVRYKREVLDKLDPVDIAKKLDGKALLCWEKPGDFCHRHLLASWLREHGFECEEYGVEPDLFGG